MGTTLTGTTPQDTYDSLIKVTNNGPLSSTARYLSDGLGNDSVLALSTTAVGVGTTTPASRLDVKSPSGDGVDILRVTSATTNSSVFRVFSTTGLGDGLASVFDRTGVERVRLYSIGDSYFTGGNVGIGTSSPSQKLHVFAAAGSDAKILLENGGAQSVLWTTRNSATNGDLRFQTMIGGSVATRMMIDYSGNVGIGTSAPSTTLHLDASGGATIRLQRTSASSNRFDVGTDGTNMEFNVRDTGNFTFGGSSSYVRLLSGTGGIQFNGDTAAANALDDYEEGTWTMGIAFGGASVGVTYGNNTGKYTKIGRQVTVTGYMNLTNKGSSTGNAVITGLPFAQTGSIQNYSSASAYLVNITFANQFTVIGLSGTDLTLYEITEAGGSSLLTNADFANTSEVLISYTYFVS